MERISRPIPLREDVELLRAQVQEKKVRRDYDNDRPPQGVDADVWGRHLATIPWTNLSLGLLGAYLGLPDAHTNLVEAAHGLRSAGDPFWFACSIISGATSASEADPVIRTAQHAVERWLTGSGRGPYEEAETPVVLRSDDASTLLHLIYAREGLPQNMVAQSAQRVRSKDPHEDRRLSNLRAIATRRFDDKQNAASLRSLIWGAIVASSGPFDDLEIGDPRVDPATVFDPITVATCLLVLDWGDCWSWVSAQDGPIADPRPQRTRKPRGWPDEISLDSGAVVYRNYIQLLQHLRPDQH